MRLGETYYIISGYSSPALLLILDILVIGVMSYGVLSEGIVLLLILAVSEMEQEAFIYLRAYIFLIYWISLRFD